MFSLNKHGTSIVEEILKTNKKTTQNYPYSWILVWMFPLPPPPSAFLYPNFEGDLRRCNQGLSGTKKTTTHILARKLENQLTEKCIMAYHL